MSLKMRKQEKKELLDTNEAKYRKVRCLKGEKNELAKQLMQLTGYKSTKSIIRHYSKKHKRRGIEKRGLRSKLHSEDIEIVKEIWLNQPSRLYADTVAY